MVEADDDDEYAEAIIEYDESFSDWTELDDDFELHSGPELFRLMHSDRDNKRYEKRGKEILRYLDERFVPVIGAIVDFVEEHPEDASVARFGFWLIMHGPFDDDSSVPQDFADAAVHIMIRHENDPVVQEYAILCIEKVTGGNERQDPGALQVFLQAMRNHPDNSGVQVAACNALYMFDSEDIIRQEWPPATILQTLNNHVHCAKVQLSALECLGYFLECGEEYDDDDRRNNIDAIVHSLEGKDMFLARRDIIEAIVQSLQTHPTNEEVQGAALDVLERIINESASLNRIIEVGGVDLVLQVGGVDLVVQAMRLGNGRAHFTAIRTLKTLFGRSTDARKKAIELGAVPMLLDVLREDKWCGAVCAALNELFLENTDSAVSLQIANEGAIELIVDAIGKYVKPVRLPLSGSIDLYSDPLEFVELKDGDILAKLAMFPADDGKLPLHYAADRGNDFHKTGRMAILEYLLKVYPEAATVRDNSGRLPLHIAIESRASLSVLEALLRANPDAGEAVCRRRNDIMLNFPPVLMAAASDCTLESIFALLRYAPTITKRQVTFISRKRKSPPA
jgi:hypothetical protein